MGAPVCAGQVHGQRDALLGGLAGDVAVERASLQTGGSPWENAGLSRTQQCHILMERHLGLFS